MYDADEDAEQEIIPAPLSWHDIVALPMSVLADLFMALSQVCQKVSDVFLGDWLHREQRKLAFERTRMEIESL